MLLGNCLLLTCRQARLVRSRDDGAHGRRALPRHPDGDRRLDSQCCAPQATLQSAGMLPRTATLRQGWPGRLCTDGSSARLESVASFYHGGPTERGALLTSVNWVLVGEGELSGCRAAVAGLSPAAVTPRP